MKKQKITGVYRITHTESGRCYVGLSVDIAKRWKAHIADVGKAPWKLHRAMAKYGVAAFSFEVLEECTAEQLGERERFWIHKTDAFTLGFNMNEGGDAPPHTPESRKKTSEALKGTKKTPEHNAKVSAANKGQKPSEAQRALFSIAAKARWDDPERRAALMASRAKKRVCSPETRARLSVALSRYMANQDNRKQRSDVMKTIAQTPEARAKTSKAVIETMKDPDVRRRIGEGVAKAWKKKKEVQS